MSTKLSMRQPQISGKRDLIDKILLIQVPGEKQIDLVKRGVMIGTPGGMVWNMDRLRFYDVNTLQKIITELS